MAILAVGGEVPTALARMHRDPEVKQLLRRETSEKCVYCESKISHVYTAM